MTIIYCISTSFCIVFCIICQVYVILIYSHIIYYISRLYYSWEYIYTITCPRYVCTCLFPYSFISYKVFISIRITIKLNIVNIKLKCIMCTKIICWLISCHSLSTNINVPIWCTYYKHILISSFIRSTKVGIIYHIRIVAIFSMAIKWQYINSIYSIYISEHYFFKL